MHFTAEQQRTIDLALLVVAVLSAEAWYLYAAWWLWQLLRFLAVRGVP